MPIPKLECKLDNNPRTTLDQPHILCERERESLDLMAIKHYVPDQKIILKKIKGLIVPKSKAFFFSSDRSLARQHTLFIPRMFVEAAGIHG